MKTPLPVLCIVGIVTVNQGRAFIAPERSPLPNFDKRATSGLAPKSPGQQAALDQLRAQLPDAVVELDPVLATPKWVRAANGFLSGPDGVGGSVSAAVAARF